MHRWGLCDSINFSFFKLPDETIFMVDIIKDDHHHGNKEKLFVAIVVSIIFVVLFALLFYGLYAGVDPLLLFTLVIIIVIFFVISTFMFDWAFYEKY